MRERCGNRADGVSSCSNKVHEVVLVPRLVALEKAVSNLWTHGPRPRNDFANSSRDTGLPNGLMEKKSAG